MSETIETPPTQTMQETVCGRPRALKCNWLPADAVSDTSGLVAQWKEIDDDSDGFAL